MAALVYSLFFALTVASALAVVFARDAVHSALCLVATMVSIAGIFLLVNAQLAAVLQILVYAGAIMVLFLFVIMLLNLGRSPEPPAATAPVRRWGGPLVAAMLFQLVVLAVKHGATRGAATFDAARTPKISEVALQLMTRYIYAFDMASVLILVAVVGSMALARRSVSASAPRAGKG